MSASVFDQMIDSPYEVGLLVNPKADCIGSYSVDKRAMDTEALDAVHLFVVETQGVRHIFEVVFRRSIRQQKYWNGE